MPARPKNTTVTLGVNTTLVNFIPKEECGKVQCEIPMLPFNCKAEFNCRPITSDVKSCKFDVSKNKFIKSVLMMTLLWTF